jgi:hypothetical protein
VAGSRASKNSKEELSFAFVSHVKNVSPTQFIADGLSPDYAVLVLSKPMTGVKPAKFNFAGLNNGETYYMYSHSPFGDAADKSAVQKFACKAVYGTTVAPQFNSKTYPVVKLVDCAVGPGNSGSPLYNSNGELVALIAGQINPNAVNGLSRFALMTKIAAEPFHYVGWATNLACFPNVFDASKSVPKECDQAFVEKKQAAAYPPDVEQRLRAALKDTKTSDDRFQYTIERTTELTKTFAFVSQGFMLRIPKCIHPTEIEAMSKTETPNSFSFDLLSISPKLSPNWQFLTELTAIEKNDGKSTIDFNQLKSTGASPIQIKIGDLEMYSGTIQQCK